MSALVPPQPSPLPLNEIRDEVLAFFMCAKPRRAGAGSQSGRVATKCRVYKRWTFHGPGRLRTASTFTATTC